MSENSETKNVEEPTIKFADDGVEHNINEMPDNAKELMARWHEKKKIRDKFVSKIQKQHKKTQTKTGNMRINNSIIMWGLWDQNWHVNK